MEGIEVGSVVYKTTLGPEHGTFEVFGIHPEYFDYGGMRGHMTAIKRLTPNQEGTYKYLFDVELLENLTLHEGK